MWRALVGSNHGPTARLHQTGQGPGRCVCTALKTVFEQLAEAQDMTKKQALAMATGMVDLVTGILKAGDRVRLSDLQRIAIAGRR